MMYLSQKGQRRKTSSPGDMRSLPPTMNGYSVSGAASLDWSPTTRLQGGRSRAPAACDFKRLRLKQPPKVITEHWLDNLRNDGLLVVCPPDQFTAPADWIPLYTSEGLQKYLPAALSAFPSQGVPSLIVVVPSEFHVGSNKEFLLCNFHRHGCLVRQSFNIEGKRRQLTFCPYCGVINENSNTALSHVRKHLDLQFVCGGCFSRSFLNGPALNKHMRTCASVTAIRDRSNR